MAIYNIVNLSYIDSNKRFDPEFFQKEYIELDNKIENSVEIIKSCKTVDLQSNGSFKTIYNIINDGKEKSVPYIRSGNVGSFFINKDDLTYISAEANNKLKKTQTKLGDILMARKGKIGGATIITEDDLGFNSNDNVTNIKIFDKRLLSEYFTTFWNSKFGLKQVERFATGNVQPWLSMKQIRMLKTFIAPIDFQLKIKYIINQASLNNINSKKYYKQAEELLNKELGLDTLVFDKPKSYVANFSEVVYNKKIAADFFQVKYRQLETLLNQLQIVRLKNLINSYSSGYAFKKSDLSKYEISKSKLIKIANIKDLGLDLNNTDYLTTKGEINGSKEKVNKGDLLIGMSGTVGNCAIVREDVQAYINQRILRLSLSDTIDINYLALVIQSKIVKMQFERMGTGGVQVNISANDILNIKIPRIKCEEEIATLVQESYKLKQESIQLLEEAKKQVEDLIENQANQN